jgi:hypothetical protein
MAVPCLGCSRDVTLIGGLCGHFESGISSGVSEAIDELDFDAEVVDVEPDVEVPVLVLEDVDEEGR